jgi:transcriptional regulator with XRE-family HTH domain
MYPNLKLQMWRSELRQTRLAQMIQLDETTLSRIVNGFRQPCPAIKARIAAALNCDLEWLFEESINQNTFDRQHLWRLNSISSTKDDSQR